MPLLTLTKFGPIPFPPLRISHVTSKDWAAFLKYSAKNLTYADNYCRKKNRKIEAKETKVIGGMGWTRGKAWRQGVSITPIHMLGDLGLFWSSSLPHLALSLDGRPGHITCALDFT